MEKTLIYHYTSLSHLIEIFKVGKLHTSQTEKMLKVKKPGLWFTSNSKWEHSAFKRFNDGKKEFDLNTPEEFEKYIGCARFVTNLNSLFVTFAKYKHKSKVNPLLWDKMAEIGKSKGANPSEWYATFSPLSINNLDIEIYENGEWHSLKKGDGDFDSELFNRNLEKTFVFKKGKEMEEKMLKEHQANQPKSDAVTDEIEPVPVADKNVSREKPVKEAALEEKPVKESAVEEKPVKESAVEEKPVKESAVEEKPKSKGILSGIKSLFSKK
jgi:hypothetical protein